MSRTHPCVYGCFEFDMPLCVGEEILYRTREGDVLKFNAETNKSTLLVSNRKFVSLYFCICPPIV